MLPSYAKTVLLTLIDVNGKTTQDFYVNGNFACGFYAVSAPSEFELRTAQQLQLSENRDKSWNFVQSHDIRIPDSGSYGMLNNNAGGASYDGKGYEIVGLRQPLFQINDGTLRNINLTEVSITTSANTAALVVDGNRIGSQLYNCFASGSVTSSANAAGLVYNSGGTIEGCGFDGSVSG